MKRSEISGGLNVDQVNQAAIVSLQAKLRRTWLLWLGYRSLALPMLLGLLLDTRPDIVGGIAWQLLWLLPAVVLTPWLVKGRSAYALLVGSMLTLIYLGGSGVVLFSRFYGNGLPVVWVYGIDLCLIFMANVWLFKVLKRLPSMNG